MKEGHREMKLCLQSVKVVTPTFLVAASLVAGCGKSSNPVQPTSLDTKTSAQSDIVPPGEGAAAIAQVRRATAQFHDIDAAIAAGYASPVGLPCDSSPAGTMGVHVANGALLGTFGVDPQQPEVLLYLPTPGGTFRLVAVEYLQPVLLRNTTTNQVAPWFSHDPWPSTYVVVNPAPSLFGQTFQGPMAGHVPGMPWHYDLHVWAWQPNPNGTFAQWNPAISCS